MNRDEVIAHALEQMKHPEQCVGQYSKRRAPVREARSDVKLQAPEPMRPGSDRTDGVYTGD